MRMNATLIDGKKLATETRAEIARGVAALKADTGVTPGLAVILVGENPASISYVTAKEKACAEAGMYSREIRLSADTPEGEVIETVLRLNADPSIHGILVQLPLPKGISEKKVIDAIAPEKDVDGFSARIDSDDYDIAACTPAAVMRMLKESGVEVAGKHCVVVGRDNMVGKPMAIQLLLNDATVTVCHSKTAELAEHTRRADVLIVAVQKPRFVTGDMVKEGAVVIDVGMNYIDGHPVGDVDFDSVEPKASMITPVPGGVGPMTRAGLLVNALKLAERKIG
jgi:methylenetetrahydrofolate dehydrogenase (NADP+)/methenyltetrahydrofolate cyclohydrolase